MKITYRHKWLLYIGLSTLIFGFFLVASVISWNFWLSPILIVLSAAGVVIPIYFRHHYRHSGKEEKQRMIDQKAFNSYYYDRWYTPADSSNLENEAGKFKKIKNKIKR